MSKIIPPEEYIDKIVFGASYDDKGTLEELIEIENEVAKRERRETPVTNHYVNRSSEEENTLKHQHLIAGVPAIVYGWLGHLESIASTSVTVSNENIGKMLKHFNEYFKEEIKAKNKRLIFTHEGTPKEWSFKNTLERGAEALEANNETKLAFIPGEIPLAFNLDNILRDPDVKSYDFILNGNSRENIYGTNFSFNGKTCPAGRRHHMRFTDVDGTVKYAKESNGITFVANDNFKSIANQAFNSRKTNPDKNQKNGGNIFTELLFKRGRIIHALYNEPTVCLYLGLMFLKNQNNKRNPIFKSSFNPAWVTEKGLTNLASICTEEKFRLKAKNEYFGFLLDYDAIEDLEKLEGMFSSIEDKNTLHPRYLDGFAFTQYLKNQKDMQDVRILQDFPNYMNEFMQNFDLLRGKQLYDEKTGEFIGLRIKNDVEVVGKYLGQDKDLEEAKRNLITITNLQVNQLKTYQTLKKAE